MQLVTRLINRPHKLCILITSLFILFSSLTATTPCPASEIIITGNESKPPKIHIKDKEPCGILIEIMKYMDQRLEDHEFTYQLFPWVRAYAIAEKGKAGIVGLSKTNRREKIFDYSDPLYFDEVILVVKKGHEFNFEKITDLYGKTVGIGRGGTFGDDFDYAVQSGLFKTHEDNGDSARLRLLLDEHIDVALISPGRFALQSVIRSNKWLKKYADQFVILPVPLKNDPNYLGFAKSERMTSFLKHFNDQLMKARNNGDLERIIKSFCEQ